MFSLREDNDERPKLCCSPCSELVPLFLSDPASPDIYQVPASMAQYLRSYQEEGVRFLFHCFRSNGGGILADDMGLGKTIQSICFIAAVLKMKGNEEDKLRHCPEFIRNDFAPDMEIPSVPPVLIICPGSLVENWRHEISTWGHFKVLTYSKNNRGDVIRKARSKEVDIIVVTVERARLDCEDLKTVNWSLILIDEIHRMKDASSLFAKAVRSFNCQYRFGLTGTPMQNNLKELWCLLDWVKPNCLGDLPSFNNNFIRPIEEGQKHHASKRELAEARKARMKLANIRKKYMLRRTKDSLKDQLPKKTDKIVFCDLTDLQAKVYKNILETPEVASLLKKCSCGSNLIECNRCHKGQSKSRRQSLLFSFMHLLLKTANHLGLLFTSSSVEQNAVAERVLKSAVADHPELQNKSFDELKTDTSQIEHTGKMKVLADLLAFYVDRSDKILLFSYSTEVLNLIEKYIKTKGYKYCRLDGKTAMESRYKIIEDFNTSSDKSVCLLSTKTGGLGLNIASANIVILYDPSWNPSHDMQAQDRAYRIGQHRDVKVYRLMSFATIEELIYLRQLYKQQLSSVAISDQNARRYFQSVSGDVENQGELFGVRNIFSFQQKRSLTEEILERQRRVEEKFSLHVNAPEADCIGVKCAEYALQTEDDLTVEGNFSTRNKFGLIFDFLRDSINVSASDAELNSDDEEKESEDEYKSNEKKQTAKTASFNINKNKSVRTVVKHDGLVGSSRAEDIMSRSAISNVFDLGMNSQISASDCNQEEMSTSSHDAIKGQVTLLHEKLFYSIAQELSLSPYEFGLKVLAMSEDEKVNLLKKYSDKAINKNLEYRSPKRSSNTIQARNIVASASERENNLEPEGENVVESNNDDVALAAETENTLTAESENILAAERERCNSMTSSFDDVFRSCTGGISYEVACELDKMFHSPRKKRKAPPPDSPPASSSRSNDLLINSDPVSESVKESECDQSRNQISEVERFLDETFFVPQKSRPKTCDRNDELFSERNNQKRYYPLYRSEDAFDKLIKSGKLRKL